MFYNLSRLLKILKISGIKSIPLLFILAFINAFFDLLSLGILLPFVTLVIEPEFHLTIKKILKNQDFLDFSYFLGLNQKEFILNLTFIAIILFTFKFLMNLFYIWYLNTKRVVYESLISTKLLKNISNSENFSIFKFSSSELIHSITHRLAMVTAAIVSLTNLIVELIVLAFIFLFLIIKFPTEAVSFLIIVSLLFITFYFLYRKIIVKWSNERGVAGDLRTKNLVEFFLGFREILINFVQESFISNFKKVNNKYLSPQKKLLIFNSLPKVILEMLLSLTFLIIVFYFILNDYDTKNMLLSASITLILCFRIFPSLNRIIFNTNQFKYSAEPIQNISNILIKTENKLDKKDPISFKKEISVDKLDFSFETKNSVIENLELKINKGDKVAIIGDTGSGKTTIADILTGLIKPDRGNIIVDKKELQNFDFNSWLKKISYVSQKIFIFNSSIRENITLTKDHEKIDEKKFLEVLKLCYLSDFVNSKQKKEFFQVGEFGSNLSGGQKQKIGLARVLYKDSDILIFDESTNALDEKSEKEIISNISNLENKTIIFITHNIKNLVYFDKTYIIKDKKLNKYEI